MKVKKIWAFNFIMMMVLGVSSGILFGKSEEGTLGGGIFVGIMAWFVGTACLAFVLAMCLAPSRINPSKP